MRPRGPWLWATALAAAGCGGEAPVLPTNTKTVPVVEERYQRRSLATWRALGGDLIAEERAAQAWALGVLEKDPAASLQVLLRRLDDPAPSVRLAAIVALGRLAPASETAARKLVGLLAAPEEALRRHARLALGRLGAAAVGPLEGALDAASVRVRWGAVTALRDLGAAAERSVPAVLRVSREDEHASVRRQARFTLARLGLAGIRACAGLLADPRLEVRSEAAAALARAGPAVVGPMAALLEHEDEEVAARAAGVLVDQGPAARPATERLIAALRREGPVRFNAAEALIAIGPSSLPALEKLLDDEDEGVAAIARYALRALKGP